MSKPLTLSIVIPAYNEEHHLEACLNAVALQTSPPDEVIVVDNNSTDKTVEIAKKYRFVKVVEEKRQGVVFARDCGFDISTGDIIGRIDADSIIPGDWVAYIKDFYSQTEHERVAWTGGCYFYNVRFPRFYGWVHHLLVFRLNHVLLGYYVLWGSNMALRRPLWQAARTKVCHHTDTHEDIDLAIHLHELSYITKYESKPKVGAKLRRVRSDRHLLWQNLQWWPRTLRVHHVKTWVISWMIGVWLVYGMSPFPPLLERIAQFFGAEPLVE